MRIRHARHGWQLLMLYLVVERFKPNAATEIYRRARARGRQLPPGLEYVDSWVDFDYTRCFQLMRTDDAAQAIAPKL
jgi:Protein of unknown function (DUF3303)